MLADAAGEREHVEAAERGGHRRDPGAQAVQVDLEREPSLASPVASAREDLAHVGGAGKPEQAGAVLERLGQLALA